MFGGGGSNGSGGSRVPTTYRPDIDGLRAIAVTAVVLFHASPASFPRGFLGVDIFFVISGFLITGLILGEIEQGTFSLVSFYERRVRRIIPAAVVMLTVTTVVALHLFLPATFVEYGKSLISAAILFQLVLPERRFLFWLCF